MILNKIETNIKRKLFLHETNNIIINNATNTIESNIIKINPDICFQNLLGFGGAFTESTGYALSTVSKDTYNQIINEYFSDSGLNYNLGRLTIGSCDFSLNSYSYSYKDDLSDFSIERDMKYVIPAIKSALKVNNNIIFVASPWSPPAFMKDNQNLINGGKLEKKYMQTWAKYLVKYINCYKQEGINIKYMTIQNEPNASQPWESCKYTAEEESYLLLNYLYPTLTKNDINTKFLIWDHNKDNILERANECLIKYGALNYSAGIAFHWYTGSFFEELKELHNLFPDKLLIQTEGCTGYSKFKDKDLLFNAELYAHEIMGDLNSGVNAFIDWNLLLDYKGGPNHKHNYCNSPIMLNKYNSGYIKTPSYYYIAQFSKYIKPGAKRLFTSSFSENINLTAFKNTDKSISIVLFNKNDFNIEYNLSYKDYIFHDNLDSHAIVTLQIID